MTATSRRPPRLSAVGAIALVSALAGCASNGQLAEHIVRANLAQEEAANQLLLLNVLRGKERHPMHFTKISAVRPAIGVGNPSVTVPTPFGPDFRTQIYNLSTQFSVQQSVDTVVLDSQEFMRGITTPVPPGLMIYMLDQGWPQQLVLHLFVRSVEIYEERVEDGKPAAVMIARLENSPGNPRQFQQFQEAIDPLRACDIDLRPTLVSRVPFGPPQSAASASLQGIAAVKSADLGMVPVDGAGKETTPGAAAAYQVVRDQRAVQIELRDRPESLPARCEGLRFQAQASGSGGAPSAVSLIGTLTNDQDNVVSRQNAVRGLGAELRAGAAPSASYAIFNLRSPEAMLYYLGEIARSQAEHPETQGPFIRFRPRPDDPGTPAVLFRVHSGAAGPGTAPVSVTYRGVSYWLPPSGENDRSMHTLSLVHQVLLLQNKGAETPGTTNVRILQ